MSEPRPVKASVFGTERFWAALNKLADERGHDGHARFLVGQTEHLDQYVLQCATCQQGVVEFIVDHSDLRPDRP